MKKLICLALCFACVVLCFCGCSKTNNNVTEQNSVADINEPGTKKTASEKKAAEEVTYFEQEDPEENPYVTTSYLIHQKYPQLPNNCLYDYTVVDITIHDPGDKTKTDIIPAYSYFPVGIAYFYNDNPDLDVYEYYTVKNNKLYKIEDEKLSRGNVCATFNRGFECVFIDNVTMYDHPDGKEIGTARPGTVAISDVYINGYYSMISKEYGLFFVKEECVTWQNAYDKADKIIISAVLDLQYTDNWIRLPFAYYNSVNEFFDQFFISDISPEGSVSKSQDPSEEDSPDRWTYPWYECYRNYYLNDGPKKY